MPHNLYLHSALVQTRALRAPDEGHRREALAYFGLESALSLMARARLGAYIHACLSRRPFCDARLFAVSGGPSRTPCFVHAKARAINTRA